MKTNRRTATYYAIDQWETGQLESIIAKTMRQAMRVVRRLQLQGFTVIDVQRYIMCGKGENGGRFDDGKWHLSRDGKKLIKGEWDDRG